MRRRARALGLHERLSQAWLASPLLVLVFYIVKLVMLRNSINAIMKGILQVTLSECVSVDDTIKLVYQAPREAVGVANQLLERSINSGIKGVKDTISMMLTMIESLILFNLQMTLGTYSCMTISAVNIAANEALNATESVIGVANKTARAVGKDINKALGKLSDFINDASGLVDSIDEFVTGSSADLSTVNLTVSKLNNLNISSNIDAHLESLRKDIPTYDGVRSSVTEAVKIPFQLLHDKIANTNVTAQFHLDQTLQVLNSPPQCNITAVEMDFSKVQASMSLIITILCVIIGLLILCSIAWNMWKCSRRWNFIVSTLKSANPFTDLCDNDVDEDMERLAYIQSGWIERLVLKRTPDRFWWLVRFVSAAPARTYLVVGFAGLVLSAIQLKLVHVFKHEIGAIAQRERHQLSNIEANIQRSYVQWSNQTNARIANTESILNRNMLGWVHQGSLGVNKTISTFVTSIQSDISSAFGGTPLETPMQDVVQCLIGNKAKEVEKGLTWAYNHSVISLPRVSQELFNKSTLDIPKGVSDTAEKLTKSLVAALENEAQTQIIVFASILSVWVVTLLVACVYDLLSASKSGNLGSEMQEKPYPEVVSGTFVPRELESTHTFRREGPDRKSTRPFQYNSAGFQDRRGAALAVDVSASQREHGQHTGSPLSALGVIGNRITRFFQGPAQAATFSVLQSPHRASIVLPETPRTPLRAMIR